MIPPGNIPAGSFNFMTSYRTCMKRYLLILLFTALPPFCFGQAFHTFNSLVALAGMPVPAAVASLKAGGFGVQPEQYDDSLNMRSRAFTSTDTNVTLQLAWFPPGKNVAMITYTHPGDTLYLQAKAWIDNHGFAIKSTQKKKQDNGYSMCITYVRKYDPNMPVPSIISVTQYVDIKLGVVVKCMYNIL